MANDTCPHCRAAMQMFSADEDWCQKCKHYRPGASGDNLAALRNQLATVTAERDEQKKRGDNHWETLRGIREIAKAGECERIILWVNDAGSGYVESAEKTMSQLKDELDEMRRRLAEAVTDCNLLRSSRDEEMQISNAWTKRCNEVREELAALKSTIAAAPVAWRVEIIGCIYESEELAIAEAQPCGCGVTRVRLLPEPEVIDAD